MIELSVENNLASYKVEISPPLLEFTDGVFMRNCIREYCNSFDLKMTNILFPKRDDRSFLLYFKKGFIDSNETFAIDIKFDSITTTSENFTSLDSMIKNHIKALDIIFSINKRDFSPVSQTVTYQANATGDEKELNQYLDSLHAFRPKLAGGLKTRAAVYGFDGPKTNSTVQLVVGDSYVVPGGLHFSLQFFFPGETENYNELLQLCVDYSRDKAIPSLELNFIEDNEVE